MALQVFRWWFASFSNRSGVALEGLLLRGNLSKWAITLVNKSNRTVANWHWSKNLMRSMIVVSGCQLSIVSIICIFRIHFHVELLTWVSYVDVGYRSLMSYRISQVKRLQISFTITSHFWFCFAPLLGQRIVLIEICFTSSSDWW